ncbi:MAG: hypothetical protein K2J72_12280 [Oscillospiraceae bacterium]|nr:hypothetical protein [Oscillospiraceae bacterium]
MFKAGDTEGEIEIPLADLELYGSVNVCELWSGERFSADKAIRVKIGSHGAKAFGITLK